MDKFFVISCHGAQKEYMTTGCTHGSLENAMLLTSERAHSWVESRLFPEYYKVVSLEEALINSIIDS